jgi:predicted alpha/beta hydrolase
LSARAPRSGYTTDALPHPRLTYGLLRAPVLALSFTDDPYAPAPAVEALLGFFKRADIEHRAIAPADVGQKALGHFAFFRRSQSAQWDQVVTWLEERTREEAPLALAAE